MNIETVMQNPMIASGVEVLTRQRADNEVDMIGSVRAMLSVAGLAQQATEHFDTNISIINAANLCPEAQRFFLNQYWFNQLSLYPSETTEHRFCLINNGPYENWLKAFELKIIPFLMSKSLPTSLPMF